MERPEKKWRDRNRMSWRSQNWLRSVSWPTLSAVVCTKSDQPLYAEADAIVSLIFPSSRSQAILKAETKQNVLKQIPETNQGLGGYRKATTG